MFVSYQVLTILGLVIAVALALAHALELPGKLRLPKDQYLAVQQIFYPGFTIGGVAEPLGLLLLIGLIVLTPFGSNSFWLLGGAFLALAAMHAAYWLLTHPVNNFWLKDVKLKTAGAAFSDWVHALAIDQRMNRTGRNCATAGNIRIFCARRWEWRA